MRFILMLLYYRSDYIKLALPILKYYALLSYTLNPRRIYRTNLRISSSKALDLFIVNFLNFSLERFTT